jgi:hypothetical protein
MLMATNMEPKQSIRKMSASSGYGTESSPDLLHLLLTDLYILGQILYFAFRPLPSHGRRILLGKIAIRMARNIAK